MTKRARASAKQSLQELSKANSRRKREKSLKKDKSIDTLIVELRATMDEDVEGDKLKNS